MKRQQKSSGTYQTEEGKTFRENQKIYFHNEEARAVDL